MKIQIDQSGKIEQTNVSTVVALANDIRLSVLLPAATKRSLQQYFRVNKKIRAFPYIVFAICTALLLKNYPYSRKVVIDQEYQGHNQEIKDYIIFFLKILKVEQTYLLSFNLIGKRSGAHDYAAQVAHKKASADKVIKIEEVVALFEALKKSGPSRTR